MKVLKSLVVLALTAGSLVSNAAVVPEGYSEPFEVHVNKGGTIESAINSMIKDYVGNPDFLQVAPFKITTRCFKVSSKPHDTFCMHSISTLFSKKED